MPADLEQCPWHYVYILSGKNNVWEIFLHWACVYTNPFILVLMLMLRNQLDSLYYTECAQKNPTLNV